MTKKRFAGSPCIHYLSDMNRAVTILGMCCILFLLPLVSQPEKQGERRGTVCFSDAPPMHRSAGAPQKKDDLPRFTQGAHSGPAQRLDCSPKALLSADPAPLPCTAVCFLEDSLVTKFTKGIYHRYRPRDPTPA